jgi:hypothetical protein
MIHQRDDGARRAVRRAVSVQHSLRTYAPYDLMMGIPPSATFVRPYFHILDTGHETLAISRQFDEHDVLGIGGDQGLGCALNVRWPCP